MAGYKGKILKVDLTSRTFDTICPSADDYRKYIGGSGLAAKFLYYDYNFNGNPLDPQKPIIFMNGPLTGTPVPNSGRHQVSAKSPATGIFGEANSGGTWGAELKYAGYDGIIVVGKSETPIYLWINDDATEIRSAERFWGRDTFEIHEPLLIETNEKAKVLAIGQAGENLIPLAAVMNDGPAGRCAARTGLGSVMGSKNLKAIVVKGSSKPSVAHMEELMEFTKSIVKQVQENTFVQHMRKVGTGGSAIIMEAKGDLPTKNWTVGTWREGAVNLSSITTNKNIKSNNYFCKGCVIGCGKEIEIIAGKYKGTFGGAPEYETVASLGSYCLVDDVEAVCKANELCNRYGIDTISVGGVVAFAMEAYERGIISVEDTGGLELKWGDGDVLIELIRKIVFKEGIGELLSHGVKYAAAKLGPIAEEFAIHVKGLELPAHDPRASGSLAVSYATSNRGACHLQGQSSIYEGFAKEPYIGVDAPLDRFADEGKGRLSASTQNIASIFDSLSLCKYLPYGNVGFKEVVKFVNLVTGWDMTEDELFKAGERIYNLKRLYNVENGISRKDDNLPSRILTLKFKEGGAANHIPNLGLMLNEYYEFRGWDEFGIPTPEKLKELGLK